VNKLSNCDRSVTYLQSNCSYRRVDTVRGGQSIWLYEHLPTSRVRCIVDLTSVETLFSMTLVQGGGCGGGGGSQRGAGGGGRGLNSTTFQLNQSRS